jgi:RNA polymerase sigma factor (sigma-70 family)
MGSLIDSLRRAVLAGGKADLTDGQLLEDFIRRRDEAAVAALVLRHGPMVWGVCRRVLPNHHDAEDAFQATFLVLARKAASVVPREMVGNWLYGVAHQTALKARATTAKRQARERQVKQMPEPAAMPEPDLMHDLEPLLDQELSRLPNKYRVAIVSCDLEGKTRKEAARELKIPEGTLSTRLRTARAMLAKRLAQRGVALSGGALAAVLSQTGASAGVPNAVVSATIRAASLAAGGQASAAGVVSPKVAVLTEGVLKTMFLDKLKAVIAVVLVLGFLVTGASVETYRTVAAQSATPAPPIAEERPATPQKQAQKQEKEPFTAWGKEVGGLQAGLGLRSGEQRAYSHGETVNLVVRVRNVGKEKVTFQYVSQFLIEIPPAVTDGKGKLVPAGLRSLFGVHLPKEVDLAPGKEIELYGELEVRPDFGTGKVSVQYERVFGNSSSGQIKLDPNLSKLATGKLELEIKSEPPAATEKKAPQKQEKEVFTAWGKEVGGLQAGLGYDPGQKRAYRLGETVRVVLRVRNVRKEEVKFEYHRTFFMEYPPVVTDGQGKLVRLTRVALSRELPPEQVNLAPGKEIELFELKFDLRPASEEKADDGDVDFGGRVSTLYGTGKFQIQYKRFIAKPSAGPESDPTLSKLATGKLELEIKSDPPPGATEKPKTPKATPPKTADAPKIEAGEQGMKVEASDLRGDALRISFDTASKTLTLEGTQTAPARLIYHNKGQNEEAHAVKIVYSLKDKTLRAESLSLARVLIP